MQPRASIVRVAAAFTAAAMVVSAGMASAAVKKKAPKPSCKIVAAKPGGISDQSLDIVYGDVASDAKNLTAVIGVAKLIASGQDSDNRLGREWDISFTIDGKQVTLQSYDGALASSFAANGTLSFDTKNNQVRVTISLADLANKLNAPVRNKASVITNFVVNTATTIVGPAVPGALRAGTYYQTGQADRVLSSAKYTAGSPSCVKVGS
ncbi:MAG: hypothetical protein QOC82_3101 [Frankiaceae bacterium]|jgi:hypothetical protein|nr:hypothetical protein [Frankiaceae bacterium]